VWFPVSPGAQQARQEAAAAIAICKDCPVRSQCLALSLRHWDVGQHGVWGGMVAAERASLRRQMLAHRADALRYFTDAVGLPSLPPTSPASTTGGRGKIFYRTGPVHAPFTVPCARPGAQPADLVADGREDLDGRDALGATEECGAHYRYPENGVFGQLAVPSVALRRAMIAPPR
jgi:hypothetical protein